MKYNLKKQNGTTESYEISYSQVLQKKAIRQQMIMNILLFILIVTILVIAWRVYSTGVVNTFISILKNIGGN